MNTETGAGDETLGFIGAGNMAEAIARGILNNELYMASMLRASDPAAMRRNQFRSMGIKCVADNLAVVAECKALIIAVKPQNLDGLLEQIGAALKAEHLLMTICAGSPAVMFEDAARAAVRVVRVMPNTPLQVGMGAAAIAAGRHATQADMDLAEAVFGAAGKVVRVSEHLMNAVTAVSGSGPAYFYYFVEALVEAGKQQGLSHKDSRALVIQTARGAAEMMLCTGLPPEELRHRVTSPGGTTEAALRCMEKHDVRQVMMEAVTAAVKRAEELGGQSGKRGKRNV